MSIIRILEILEEFVIGETYNLDLAGGRIFIIESDFDEAVAQFLATKKGANHEEASRDLNEIRRLNAELQVDSIDDPEPLENSLLEKCDAFLKKHRGFAGNENNDP